MLYKWLLYDFLCYRVFLNQSKHLLIRILLPIFSNENWFCYTQSHEKLEKSIRVYVLKIFGVQNLYMFLADNCTVYILWVYDDDMCANSNVPRMGILQEKGPLLKSLKVTSPSFCAYMSMSYQNTSSLHIESFFYYF